MEKLAQLMSIKDVGIILEHIHSMVVLVESDGTLVSWNPSFDSYKKIFSLANKLEDFFPQKDKKQVITNLTAKTKHSWIADILLNEDQQTLSFGCLLIPLSNERILFIAEHIESNSARAEIV